jgi:hypothetical protein
MPDRFPTDRAMVWSVTIALIAVTSVLNVLKVESKFLETTATGFAGASLALALPRKGDNQ